ncbi:hypothetical protein EGW08_018981 [Elysia chlorotica]|uniref:C-type lectin domain-containing protein n=1 Tax=Elysia chlorotica TaxID=188477 RepID=A0A3S1BRM5_ELYCH|nr:hypothetical protein EGW08_018981 [Elysia chlorotica]
MLLLTPACGELFDFRAIPYLRNRSRGESLCQNLGYAGLAIISSPEMYVHALTITQSLRATGHGLYIGLHNTSDTHEVTWADGTLPALDSPWLPSGEDVIDATNKEHGLLSKSGYLRAINDRDKYALCGSHKNLATEGHGTSLLNQQPTGVGSILSETRVLSYLECVLLCGQDYRCRVAHFNFDLLTCRTLEAESYTGFTANSKSRTFVRNGYL